MANRLGTNSAIYDVSRLMTFMTGQPPQNVFNAPIILDNPDLTSGVALFSHTPQPFSVTVAAASEMSLFDLNFANTGGAGTQFYGLKIQSDSDVVDTGAGIALFNLGRADAIYIDVAGKAANAANNSPTGIGIDVNKSPTSTAERASANSSQQGAQIWDHSTTDQGVGGPRCLFLNKFSNMNTDHFLATFKANRNALQFVMEAADGIWDGTQPLVRVDDSDSGQTWWQIRQSGEQLFNKDGIGIQWITPGAKTAYILASTNDLKLKSGGTGVRFVNQADTQTIVLMNDDLSVDIPNNEVRFKALKIVEDRLENYATNALAAVSLNYNGYNGGTTQFRETKIFDGKQNVTAIFTGQYRNLLFATSTDKGTGTPHILINDGSQITQYQNSTSGFLALTWNAWYDGANWKRRVATNVATQVLIGVGSAAGSLEIAFPSDGNNTVDSNITFSRAYYFGPGTIGFFGGGPSSKATVTGFDGGNLALASLLTGLAGYGLITNSSTNGMIYGGMYADNITQNVTIAAINTHYEVGGGMSGGNTNGVTFQNSKELKILTAGTYLITYQISVECASANQEAEASVMVNSTQSLRLSSHAIVTPANQPNVLAGTNPLTLAVNDVVKFCIANHTSTTTLVVSHANMSIVRMGN